MAVKFREVIKILEEDGWHLVRQKGSHKQYKHPEKKGLVTVTYHSLSDTVPPGTLNSIYKQAQIER
ncbi:type II toxin-antitoxin system HicA family toxin [Nibrella viscosa]|uniref:Type II toxin-antitoxin system HicA family toxin n=1 Tax=Nibrella viscosa TaxID=1084524 RepID=A0ABP8KPJ5_9BACT